ncbi:MAG TPA: TRZ/ATZ family hydrolase [Casimicrobiaceae bacterium]|nr:TRZ/ATZ family hydrolase [Casimicrobiaceae bacterium]
MTTRHVDLALRARWILPIEPEGVLTDHVVLVDAGRVVAVAARDDAERDYLPRETIDLEEHALLPGLINAHTHAAMSLLRGIADDVPLATWLSDHIWPREAKFVSPEFVHDGALLGAAEMLRGGTTCCNDMYFYPEASARAYQAAGMRAVLGLPVLDFPTPYASDADAYLRAGLAARDAFKHAPRLTFMLAPHAPYTVGDATFEKIVTYSRQLDIPIQSHVQETKQEVDDAMRATGESPLTRLDRLGATGAGFVAVHGVHLSQVDVELLARQGCSVVHCPTSNMKLASGAAPIAELLARGVNVALGTDGPASNNRLDLFSEVRLASLLAKLTTGNAAAMPAATALRMATLGGAKALSLDHLIGTIEAGKQADLIAVDLSHLDDAPVYDPVSHLVHVTGRERVSDVWIDGERVVKQGELNTIDEAALRARVSLWRARLG